MGDALLGYSPAVRRISFLGMASLAAAAFVVIWHIYVIVKAGSPPHWRFQDALWMTAYDYRWTPAAAGAALAILGLLQRGKKRWPCVAALGVIAATYVLLAPPMNFA